MTLLPRWLRLIWCAVGHTQHHRLVFGAYWVCQRCAWIV